MEILNVIINRHSTRAFTAEPLPQDKLDLIIEAGRLAPSGMNDRSNRIYVFRKGSAMDGLQLVLKDAAMRGNADGITREKAKLMQSAGYSFCHGAPVFILLTHRGDQYNAFPDGACVLENMMLQAEELGVGACWINIVRRAQKDKEVRALLAEFGVETDEIVTGGLALGYAAGKPKERNNVEGNEVIYIE